MKKSIKKVKKIWKFNFLPYLCSRNQTTNTPKGKKKIQVKQLNTKQYGENSKRRIYPKRKSPQIPELDNGCRQVGAGKSGVFEVGLWV